VFPAGAPRKPAGQEKGDRLLFRLFLEHPTTRKTDLSRHKFFDPLNKTRWHSFGPNHRSNGRRAKKSSKAVDEAVAETVILMMMLMMGARQM